MIERVRNAKDFVQIGIDAEEYYRINNNKLIVLKVQMLRRKQMLHRANMHFVAAKGILTATGGSCGMNIYRGCTHGCIYCDSRSRCYQFTHPFEDIEVKQNAPALLEKALRSKRKKCMIGTGAMSDPYMHCEEKLGLTRKCLEIILDLKNTGR